MLAPPSITARPCKYGHTTGRYRNGKCIECHRLESKARYDADPAGFRARRAARPITPSQTKEGRNARARQNRKNTMLYSARNNAKRNNLPCTIKKNDVVIPEFCPLLGIKIECTSGPRTDNSPSLDKIIPEFGYVPGNVWVVSWRANRLKSDSTLTELRMLVENLSKVVRKFPWERP